MAIPLYLAKTAAEIAYAQEQPDHLAWMACHFSPYGTGLTNVPETLPSNTLLILNDRTPVHGHDPDRIMEILKETVSTLDCAGVLLDFQRPGCPETVKITETLQSLPCPVCVSEHYAQGLDCPVFLPPVPLTVPIEKHLTPWQGREIWLEAALGCICCTVTENGSVFVPTITPEHPSQQDTLLHCHYRMETHDDSITFTIWRTRDDLDTLLEEAKARGVNCTVGLWQELKVKESPAPF